VDKVSWTATEASPKFQLKPGTPDPIATHFSRVGVGGVSVANRRARKNRCHPLSSEKLTVGAESSQTQKVICALSIDQV
jgi:hypothetical protein